MRVLCLGEFLSLSCMLNSHLKLPMAWLHPGCRQQILVKNMHHSPAWSGRYVLASEQEGTGECARDCMELHQRANYNMTVFCAGRTPVWVER